MMLVSRITRLFVTFFLFASPLAAHADVSSLVWGGALGGPEQVTMADGGTYAVPLNTSAPAFVTGPLIGPDGEFVSELFGNLYKITDSGTREYIETLYPHNEFDDPDDPDDGDVTLAWPSTGSYELDILSLPPAVVSFEDRLRHWMAQMLFAGIAHAQFGEPIFHETIRFTIEEATANEPDPVIIIPGILGSEQHNGVWVIDPILHTYDDLIATLDANGYTRDVDLFTFPYNWRKSNVETALLLKEKIDEVKGICTCDKVDLVAHSMGGLVARQYIQSAAYQGDVDQLIFLGTPHLGAPKAYLMWEGGETDPIGFFSSVLRRILSQEAKEKRYSDLFNYIQNEPVPSVQELLPVYDYIFDGAQLRNYPANYPINLFLESLNTNVNDLVSSGVRTYNFVGDTGADDTINGITVVNTDAYLPRWAHGYPIGFEEEIGNFGLERGAGDETVPVPSASFIQSNLDLSTHSHGALPDGVKGKVYQVLTDNEAITLVDNFNFPNFKLIFIKMLSPADLLVVAPDRSKIGKDFDGQEVNGIPNAFYTGFGTDTEFVTILNPLDGEYKIYTQGTGSGLYTVEVAYVSEEGTTEKSFTGNTTPGLTTELDLTLDVEQGLPDLDILPTDTEPPVITITAPEAKDYPRSVQMPVNVSAEDAGSGVFALETFLDGVLIPNVGSIDLFFQSLGTHMLLASSTDNVGNAATSTRTFRVIATIDSTPSDIDRAYSLGWMSKKVYRNIKNDFKDAIETKKGKKKVDKEDLKDILEDMRDYRKKVLNEHAYRLLKEDFEWLINN